MSEQTNRRKMEHIDAIKVDPNIDRKAGHFDNIRLTHRALPEINRNDVDASVVFLGKKLSFPFIISSMTGGNHKLLRTVNRNLAIAAQATGVAMAVGSQRVMIENSNARSSFELRPFAPDTVLLANLGGVQLNYGYGLSECEEAIAALDADGLYFHLNPLQEAVQSEGNTNFAGLWQKIEHINRTLNKPVLLKEVGCGMSPVDIQEAVDRGIQYIDVAGHGGTSWSRIEHHRTQSAIRSNNTDLTCNFHSGIAFQDWGISTPEALKMAAPWKNQVTLIASGGLRGGIDMIKSVILGARLCGLAAPLLQPAMKSADEVILHIEALKEAFITAMFILGAQNIEQIRGNSALIISTF